MLIGSARQWWTTAPGNDYAYFHRTGGGVDGTYFPGPHCTGHPEVASASVPYWSYVNPTDDERPILTAVVEYVPSTT